MASFVHSIIWLLAYWHTLYPLGYMYLIGTGTLVILVFSEMRYWHVLYIPEY